MSRVAQDESRGVELCLSWQPGRGGEIPAGAVSAGPGVYVARARLEGEWVPGKTASGHPHAFVPHGGKEHTVDEYEVLVETAVGAFGPGYHWEAATDGQAPKRALVAGHCEGAPVFVARAEIDGEMCAGKMHSGYGRAYMPHGSQENEVTEYEVLVFDKP